jgi:hypothetical protein
LYAIQFDVLCVIIVIVQIIIISGMVGVCIMLAVIIPPITKSSWSSRKTGAPCFIPLLLLMNDAVMSPSIAPVERSSPRSM